MSQKHDFNLYINTIRKSVSQLVPVAALATMVAMATLVAALKKKWNFFSMRYGQIL